MGAPMAVAKRHRLDAAFLADAARGSRGASPAPSEGGKGNPRGIHPTQSSTVEGTVAHPTHAARVYDQGMTQPTTEDVRSADVLARPGSPTDRLILFDEFGDVDQAIAAPAAQEFIRRVQAPAEKASVDDLRAAAGTSVGVDDLNDASFATPQGLRVFFEQAEGERIPSVIDSEVDDVALAANTAQTWPKSKLPSDTVYDSTQRFTTALLAKLNGIEAGATVGIGSGPQDGRTQQQVFADITTRVEAAALKESPSERWAKARLPSDTVYEANQRFTTALQTKLDALDVRSIGQPTVSGSTLTIPYTDGGGTARTYLVTLPSGGTGGLNQAAVDARITTLRPNPFTSADETKLDGIAAGAEVNVQSDWNATGGDAFIRNKPDVSADGHTHGAITESDVLGAIDGLTSAQMREFRGYIDAADADLFKAHPEPIGSFSVGAAQGSIQTQAFIGYNRQSPNVGTGTGNIIRNGRTYRLDGLLFYADSNDLVLVLGSPSATSSDFTALSIRIGEHIFAISDGTLQTQSGELKWTWNNVGNALLRTGTTYTVEITAPLADSLVPGTGLKVTSIDTTSNDSKPSDWRTALGVTDADNYADSVDLALSGQDLTITVGRSGSLGDLTDTVTLPTPTTSGTASELEPVTTLPAPTSSDEGVFANRSGDLWVNAESATAHIAHFVFNVDPTNARIFGYWDFAAGNTNDYGGLLSGSIGPRARTATTGTIPTAGGVNQVRIPKSVMTTARADGAGGNPAFIVKYYNPQTGASQDIDFYRNSAQDTSTYWSYRNTDSRLEVADGEEVVFTFLSDAGANATPVNVIPADNWQRYLPVIHTNGTINGTGAGDAPFGVAKVPADVFTEGNTDAIAPSKIPTLPVSKISGIVDHYVDDITHTISGQELTLSLGRSGTLPTLTETITLPGGGSSAASDLDLEQIGTVTYAAGSTDLPLRQAFKEETTMPIPDTGVLVLRQRLGGGTTGNRQFETFISAESLRALPAAPASNATTGTVLYMITEVVGHSWGSNSSLYIARSANNNLMWGSNSAPRSFGNPFTLTLHKAQSMGGGGGSTSGGGSQMILPLSDADTAATGLDSGGDTQLNRTLSGTTVNLANANIGAGSGISLADDIITFANEGVFHINWSVEAIMATALNGTTRRTDNDGGARMYLYSWLEKQDAGSTQWDVLEASRSATGYSKSGANQGPSGAFTGRSYTLHTTAGEKVRLMVGGSAARQRYITVIPHVNSFEVQPGGGGGGGSTSGGGGLDQAAVDARVAAGVLPAVRTGSTTRLPLANTRQWYGTQSEFDALVSARTVETDVQYNVYSS